MSLFKISASITKSIIINKPTETVFSFVRDYKNNKYWSPWFIMEPSVELDFTEETDQEGSSYFWEGKYIGSGESRQIKIITNKTIYRDFEFLKPWKSKSKIRFEFTSKGDSTEISWQMDTTLPIFMFWMKNRIINWIGADFFRGLSMLKEYLETGRVASKISINEITEHSGFQYMGIKSRCTIEKIGSSMKEDFEALKMIITERNIEATKPTFSIYHTYDLVNNLCIYTAGIGIKEKKFDLPEKFTFGIIKKGKSLNLTHIGSYQNLGNAWATAYSYIKGGGIKLNKKVDPLEVYTDDLENKKSADSVTEIYIPVK